MIYSSSLVLESEREWVFPGFEWGSQFVIVSFTTDNPFYSASVVDEQGSREAEVVVDGGDSVVKFIPRFAEFRLLLGSGESISYDLEDLFTPVDSGGSGGGSTPIVRTSRNQLVSYWLGEGELE